ncbi:hypothetical protein CROQUDRAFT_101775 [Cronartium quercuum f. sp. fusiforme G11]|uniref:Uncharacterized protein n=1 Tax=Cronartium quercuum f. sp. fusiforme G11 TaxID=708437 RepID=A0A9P6N5Y2_9BASI|nr:hypothetical protein CROQUDRAFT_101775 [Cronartium quercuum f. sp. fusiforme G11]
MSQQELLLKTQSTKVAVTSTPHNSSTKPLLPIADPESIIKAAHTKAWLAKKAVQVDAGKTAEPVSTAQPDLQIAYQLDQFQFLVVTPSTLPAQGSSRVTHSPIPPDTLPPLPSGSSNSSIEKIDPALDSPVEISPIPSPFLRATDKRYPTDPPLLAPPQGTFGSNLPSTHLFVPPPVSKEQNIQGSQEPQLTKMAGQDKIKALSNHPEHSPTPTNLFPKFH